MTLWLVWKFLTNWETHSVHLGKICNHNNVIHNAFQNYDLLAKQNQIMIQINHCSTLSYSSSSELTEECFQKTPLPFTGLQVLYPFFFDTNFQHFLLRSWEHHFYFDDLFSLRVFSGQMELRWKQIILCFCFHLKPRRILDLFLKSSREDLLCL